MDGGIMGAVEVLSVADHATAGQAVAGFLARHREAGPVAAAAIGVAGPVDNGRCTFTNSDWVVDAAELEAEFGFRKVRVVNDFAAAAWSLPHLSAADLVAIGGQEGHPDAPRVVLGPGTGLGMACLVPGSQSIVVASEGGHATLPATTRRQDDVLRWLRGRFGHVSIERVLSGDGLVNLHDALAAIDGRSVLQRDAPAITEAALRDACPVCREALDTFCALLGGVAGDLALTFGARGGVYIAGGIVPRIVDFLARSAFRAQFEAKGRFQGYLAALPVRVIVRRDAAFVGLAALVDSESALA
ncbi:MAG: glucokinase [Alphaproteobacteria bacterium]|nr:glucokinase [Alphaproteobacteria bacterium]